MDDAVLTTRQLIQRLIRMPAQGDVRRRLELARELGIDESYISRLLKGERRPGTRIASRLAELSERRVEIRNGAHAFIDTSSKPASPKPPVPAACPGVAKRRRKSVGDDGKEQAPCLPKKNT